MKTNTKTGIILVNWNNVEDTLQCVHSLLNSTLVPEIILVWDNGSSSNQARILVESFPEIRVVPHPENVGFAAANNFAAQILLDEGMDFIWILNNDTTVDSHCLQTFLNYAESHPEFDALTGLILEMDRPDSVWFAGGIFEGLSLHSAHQLMGQSRKLVPNTPSFTPFVSGCNIFIPKKTLLRFGLFPNDYIAYYEDSDWSLRLLFSKASICFLPEAVIYHKCSGSIKINNPSKGTLSPLQHFFMTRNRLWSLRRYARKYPKYRIGILLLICEVSGYAVVNFFMGRLNKTNKILQGLSEGLLKPIPPPFTFTDNRSTAQERTSQ